MPHKFARQNQLDLTLTDEFVYQPYACAVCTLIFSSYLIICHTYITVSPVGNMELEDKRATFAN